MTSDLEGKHISKVLGDKVDKADVNYDSNDDDDHLWPEAEKKGQQAPEKEEDIYGYGDAAPSARRSSINGAVIVKNRRSSLKGSAGGSGPSHRRASIGYTGEMTLILPTGEKTQRKTSITFCEDAKNEVREIESVVDMVDNPARLWFQQKEYEHIQEKILAILKESKKEGVKDGEPSWVCTRGLESIMDRSGAEVRQEALQNLLEEQRMQKAYGKYDDNYLRDIYEFHTIDSKVKASSRAQADAQDVEPYLKFTRKLCRRLSC